MFYGCRSLEELDCSSFYTEKVTEFITMFFDCNNLKKLDISNLTIGDSVTSYANFLNNVPKDIKIRLQDEKTKEKIISSFNITEDNFI